MSQTDLALQNIHERLTLFSTILHSFDDDSHRQTVTDLIICSNCGLICNHNLSKSAKIAPHKPSERFTHTTVAFLGKTPHFDDRKFSFSALCFGCARAFQHCKRQNKNFLEFVRLFLHCFHVGKASSGVHQDYANSSKPVKITCPNCKIGCKDEYYHGLRTFFAVQSSSDLLKLPIDDQTFIDICGGCYRAFYAAQAQVFSDDGLAYEFQRLSMDPLKCLTKIDFDKEYSEKSWTIQRYAVNSALTKGLFSDLVFCKESFFTEEDSDDDENKTKKKNAAIHLNALLSNKCLFSRFDFLCFFIWLVEFSFLVKTSANFHQQIAQNIFSAS